ncbi:MAG TPA: 4-aminobutyrate--2-oxoglutarate transaminase, partial [Thiolinea sp.]|nr:4-aminobutyrate--2-oxoglutarate transaminase [Thiolinea sp.]
EGKPSPELTASLVAKARDKGLILLSCGIYGNVVRILMPLTVPDEQLKRGLAILAESIAELA